MRNYKLIDRLLYGRGTFGQLAEVLQPLRQSDADFAVFLIDHYFEGKELSDKVPALANDLKIYIDVTDEPKTKTVDELVDKIKSHTGKLPVSVVGIGGGSVMDYAKAISLMVTNPGKAQDYQGLDLIKNKGVHCTVVPTISGTGAEVSMTAVLTGPEKKLGIKCDYTIPDQVLLDPDLIVGVPKNQWFYTGMDSYIHAIEALNGYSINEMGRGFGIQSLELCREVFLNPFLTEEQRDEKLMVASYMGGLSLTYSQVGVCHALSYGLSYVLGTHHGIANCIAFQYLGEYYPEGVEEFKAMVHYNDIEIPKGICANCTEEQLAKMADIAYALDHMWLHAFGSDWKQTMTKEKLIELFRKM